MRRELCFSRPTYFSKINRGCLCWLIEVGNDVEEFFRCDFGFD
jgi:hypothetical protein